MSGFGKTPRDNTGIPLSSVAVPGHVNADLTALRGANPSTDSNGNETADASIAIPDGNNVTQGFITDAAVTGDNPGTLSAKLRGLTKIFADVWDSVNHRLHVNVDAGSVTTKASFKEVTSAYSGTGQILPSQDVSGYGFMSVQVGGIFNGGALFQISNDGVNWANYPLQSFPSFANLSTSFSGGNSGQIYYAPVVSHYFQIVSTFYNSGTINITFDVFADAPSLAFGTVAADADHANQVVASAAYIASGNGPDFASVFLMTTTSLDINITAVSGTNPTINFFIDRKGDDGTYNQIWASVQKTGTGVVSVSVGPGCTVTESLGLTIRLRWVIAGTNPSFTFQWDFFAKS